MPNSSSFRSSLDITQDPCFFEIDREHLLVRLLPEHPQATLEQSRALAKKRLIYSLALQLADHFPVEVLAQAQQRLPGYGSLAQIERILLS